MEKPVSGFNHLVKKVNKKVIINSGKKSETDDINDKIAEWILINIKLGITVTSLEVISKLPLSKNN